MPRSGLLVVFEGIDGAGKSTQIRRLEARLAVVGIAAISSREPTDGPWGRKIRASAVSGRMSPEDELAAFVADRRQHVAELIAPALARGDVVMIDRYYFSTVAYQGARGFDPAELLAAHRFAPAPDVLFIFDLDPAVGLARVRARGASDQFEMEDELRRVREIFLGLAVAGREVIDASLPPDEIASVVIDRVAAAYATRTGDLERARRLRSSV